MAARDHYLANAYQPAAAQRAPSVFSRAVRATVEAVVLGAFLTCFVMGAVIFAACA